MQTDQNTDLEINQTADQDSDQPVIGIRGMQIIALIFSVLAVLCAGLAFSITKQGSTASLDFVMDAPVVLIRSSVVDSQVSAGMDRAAALDTAINRALLAQAAKQQFSEAAKKALAIGTEEVLAQTYLSESTKKITAGVTDSDVKAWFDSHIANADYRSVKGRYVLLSTPEAAAQIVASARAGDTSKFESLAKGDGFLPVANFPYGVGPMLAKFKAGEVVGPLTVRDGFLVVVVDAFKDGQSPKLESSKEEVRQLIIRERLAEQIKALRANSKIIIK